MNKTEWALLFFYKAAQIAIEKEIDDIINYSYIKGVPESKVNYHR